MGAVFAIIFGFRIIMWSKDSRDSYDSREEILAAVDAKKLSEGEILILMTQLAAGLGYIHQEIR